jgi:hypothetical protein
MKPVISIYLSISLSSYLSLSIWPTHPVDLAVECEDECGGMLGHGIGRVGRHVRHLTDKHTGNTHTARF